MKLYKSESSQNMKVQNALQRKWWYRTHVACTYMAYTSSAASLVLVPSIFVNLSCVGFFLALKKDWSCAKSYGSPLNLEYLMRNISFDENIQNSPEFRIFSPHLLPFALALAFRFSSSCAARQTETQRGWGKVQYDAVTAVSLNHMKHIQTLTEDGLESPRVM